MECREPSADQPLGLVSQPLGEAATAHNPVVNGKLLYVSWYQAGLVAFDVSVPLSPVQVGRYDTHCGPLPPAFSGNWGVYT